MAKGKRSRRNETSAKKSPKQKPTKPPPLPVLDDDGAAGRSVIAAWGEHLVLCDGTSLRLHTVDAPIRHIKTGARIVAVARSERLAAALDRFGVVHFFDDIGDVVATRPAGDAPRSLVATADGGFVAVFETGVAIFDANAEREGLVEYPRALCAAADPDGAIVIVGEERRLAEHTGGELLDLPPCAEQIVAIAPLGGRRFACVGQKNLFLLDLAVRELESLGRTSESPKLATSPDGQRIAWTAPNRVEIGRIAGTTITTEQSATYPGSYSRPTGDEVLRVHGVAFLDDDRVVVALDKGRGNILLLGEQKALKLDEQPADPRSSWVFIYNGKILVAG